jgi:serine protease SohB
VCSTRFSCTTIAANTTRVLVCAFCSSFGSPICANGLVESFNIQKTLKGWGVQPLDFRGGRDKAPVGLIGEVTKEGLAKVQDMVDDTHPAFKCHITVSARPVVTDRIKDLATGNVWLGYDALDIGLIDRIMTSGEYLGSGWRKGPMF